MIKDLEELLVNKPNRIKEINSLVKQEPLELLGNK